MPTRRKLDVIAAGCESCLGEPTMSVGKRILATSAVCTALVVMSVAENLLVYFGAVAMLMFGLGAIVTFPPRTTF